MEARAPLQEIQRDVSAKESRREKPARPIQPPPPLVFTHSKAISASSAASAQSALIDMLERPRRPSQTQLSERPSLSRTPSAHSLSPGISLAPTFLSLGSKGQTSIPCASATPVHSEPSCASSLRSTKRRKWLFSFSSKTTREVTHGDKSYTISEPRARQELPEIEVMHRLSAAQLLAQFDASNGIDVKVRKSSASALDMSNECPQTHMHTPTPLQHRDAENDDEEERLASPAPQRICSEATARAQQPPSIHATKLARSPSQASRASRSSWVSRASSLWRQRGLFGLFSSKSSPNLSQARMSPQKSFASFVRKKRRRPDDYTTVPAEAARPKAAPQVPQVVMMAAEHDAVSFQPPKAPGQWESSVNASGADASEKSDSPIDSLRWLSRSSMLFPQTPSSIPAPSGDLAKGGRIASGPSIGAHFVALPIKPKPVSTHTGAQPSRAAKRRGSVSMATSITILSSTSSSSSNPKVDGGFSRAIFVKERANKREDSSQDGGGTKVSEWLSDIQTAPASRDAREPVHLQRANSDVSMLDPRMERQGGTRQRALAGQTASHERSALRAQAIRRLPGSTDSDGSVLDPLFDFLPAPQDDNELVIVSESTKREMLRTPTPGEPRGDELPTLGDQGDLNTTPRSGLSLLPPVGMERSRHASELSTSTNRFPSSVCSQDSFAEDTARITVDQGDATPTQTAFGVTEPPLASHLERANPVNFLTLSSSDSGRSDGLLSPQGTARSTPVKIGDALLDAKRVLAEGRAKTRALHERAQSPITTQEVDRARTTRERMERRIEQKRQRRAAREQAC